jgi:hypothetical protein
MQIFQLKSRLRRLQPIPVLWNQVLGLALEPDSARSLQFCPAHNEAIPEHPVCRQVPLTIPTTHTTPTILITVTTMFQWPKLWNVLIKKCGHLLLRGKQCPVRMIKYTGMLLSLSGNIQRQMFWLLQMPLLAMHKEMLLHMDTRLMNQLLTMIRMTLNLVG